MSIFNSLLAGAEGLEFETGTWTPASDVLGRATIEFSKTHSKPPTFVAISMVLSTEYETAGSNTAVNFFAVDYSTLLSALSGQHYNGCGMYARTEVTSSTYSSCGRILYGGSNAGASNTSYFRYFADENAMYPTAYNPNSTYWRSNKVYNWIAIWT